MPQDAPPNGSAQDPVPEGPWSRVAGMQAKLHRWAAADSGRRFDDLFNFVHDPATLLMAFGRVAGNKGANTPTAPRAYSAPDACRFSAWPSCPRR
jgi:RNA-directed DNA polymerase